MDLVNSLLNAAWDEGAGWDENAETADVNMDFQPIADKAAASTPSTEGNSVNNIKGGAAMELHVPEAPKAVSEDETLPMALKKISELLNGEGSDGLDMSVSEDLSLAR